MWSVVWWLLSSIALCSIDLLTLSQNLSSFSTATPTTLTMIATSKPQPLITTEWKFDPAITFVTYRTHWQKAETVAKQRLVLLQKATKIDELKFLHLLDDLIAFTKLHQVQAELWESSHPVSEMRSEAQKARVCFEGLLGRAVSSPALGRILENVKGRDLDDHGRRFLERAKREARRSGAFLSKEDRKEFRAVSDQLEALQEKFRQNVRGEEGTVCECVEEGGCAIVKEADTARVLAQSSEPKDEAEVERAYKATYSIAPQNEQFVQRMVELRHKRARLLGYANFVEYALEAETLVDHKTIRNELAKASERAAPLAGLEMAALSDAMKTKGKELKAWNFQEAKALLLRQRFSQTGDAAQKFLSYETVVSRLLQLIGEMFSLEFCKVAGAKAWDPSVQVYEVYDIQQGDSEAGSPVYTGRHLLGRIYLDLVDRPDKDQEARTFPVFPSLPDSGLLPAVCLGGSFILSETMGLDFSFVATMLHELVHCVHFVLAQQSHYHCFNTYEDETDFEEIPGQLFEELLHQETVAKRIAVDASGRCISDKELQPLLAEREMDNYMFLREQILYSIICVS